MNDLISRQAAMDALARIFDQCEEIEAHLPKGDPDITGYKMYPDYMIVWEYLHQLPSAEPEWEKGKWLMHSDFPDRLICSECGAQFDVWHWESKQMHFCPNCGKPMERGEEDE